MNGGEDLRYCTFHVDDLYLGVPVMRVQEVIRSQERTIVPLVSPVIDGLINLRGEIVTTVDLRRRLDLPGRPADARSMNVVIRFDDSAVSLLVDEIRDVIDVDQAQFEPIPPTLSGPCRDVLTGVFKLPDALLLVLDIERLLDVAAGMDHREAVTT